MPNILELLPPYKYLRQPIICKRCGNKIEISNAPCGRVGECTHCSNRLDDLENNEKYKWTNFDQTKPNDGDLILTKQVNQFGVYSYITLRYNSKALAPNWKILAYMRLE